MNEAVKISSDSLKDLLSKESNNSVRFRTASVEDIAALAPLINEAYLYENEGEKAFKQSDALRVNDISLEQVLSEGAVVVAIDPQSEKIFGCVHYKEILTSAGSDSDQNINVYFGMLTVDPRLQGQGHGKRLLKIAEEIGKARGRNTMEIQVVNHSTHLLNIYARLGYKEFRRTDWQAPFLTRPTQFVLMSKSLTS